ncbi:BLUF domain-containing protein [Qipengyuania sediminis]|uniref:BLUF domain-containing protein n=1 Tax=Qipengyuania sediminis TaxID=1532023 RepID=UPI00105A7C76|nr:BLUF domain-containing protein [Qipengyuania sediminis]
MMHQVVYVSEAAPGLGSQDVFRIIEQSARNNPSADITGFLIFRGGRFLQLVEGPLMSLETLLQVLERDPRHHSLRVLSRTPVAARSFGRWRMRRLGGDGEAAAELEASLLAESGAHELPAPVREFLRVTIAA